MKQYKYR